MAKDYADEILVDRAALYLYFDFITDDYVKGALSKVATGMFHTSQAINKLLDYSSAYSPEFSPIYYVKQYAGGTEYELTWEKIIEAWTKADDLGRLWTVLSIDFMRKESWNEPVTSFMMKSGKVSG